MGFHDGHLKKKLEYLSLVAREIVEDDSLDGDRYADLDYHTILELEKDRLIADQNRLESINSIIQEWEKHSADYTQKICAVDPAPLINKTHLWLQNSAYQALNKFLSQYSIEYCKRNNSFGTKRIFIVPRKLNRQSMTQLANIIDLHMDLKIDVGIVFEDQAKDLVAEMYYNCNVIYKKMATDAHEMERDYTQSVTITNSRIAIQNFYENFRILDRSAIKFDNMAIPIDMRTSDSHWRTRIKLSPPLKFYIFLRSGGKCEHCGSEINLQYDHVYPYSLGGSNDTDNFQILCSECNRKKSNRI